jgi:hypothetical protein
MTLQYAIEEIVPLPTTPPGNIHRWNSELVYHPVTKEVAETHENGAFSLVNYHGVQVTPWRLMNDRKAEKVAKAVKAAKSSAPPHKDILGEELAVGDYVVITQMETADLYIGKVLAFTEKKVRVISYCGYYDVLLKNPSGLAKINPVILSD